MSGNSSTTPGCHHVVMVITTMHKNPEIKPKNLQEQEFWFGYIQWGYNPLHSQKEEDSFEIQGFLLILDF